MRTGIEEGNVGCKPIESFKDGIKMESPEDLNRLLLWLGANTDDGARRYEEIRTKLILLFRLRGCSAADELADETIDRTARALSKPGFFFSGNPIAYFRGVAHNVYLESLRQGRRFVPEAFGDIADPATGPAGNDPGSEELSRALEQCLERCLDRLPGEKRALLLGYYQGEKQSKINNRQQLAREGGTGINSLRIQVFRLRKTVRNCVENCSQTRET